MGSTGQVCVFWLKKCDRGVTQVLAVFRTARANTVLNGGEGGIIGGGGKLPPAGQQKHPKGQAGLRDHTEVYIAHPVAPVAHQVILEPGIGQFREFETPRVHTRIHSLALFLVHKLTCGKRESVS